MVVASRLKENVRGLYDSIKGVFTSSKNSTLCREETCHHCSGSLTAEGQKRAIQTVQECGHKYHEACLKKSLTTKDNIVNDSECKKARCHGDCESIVAYKHVVENGAEKLFFNEDESDETMEKAAVKTQLLKGCKSKEACQHPGPGYLKTVGYTTAALGTAWLGLSFSTNLLAAGALGAAVYVKPDLFDQILGKNKSVDRSLATKVVCQEDLCKACQKPLANEDGLASIQTIRKCHDRFHESCLKAVLTNERNQIDSDESGTRARCIKGCKSVVEFQVAQEGDETKLIFKEENGQKEVILDKVASCKHTRSHVDGNPAFVRYATAASVALGVLWFARGFFHLAIGGLVVGSYLYAKPKIEAAYQKAAELIEPLIPKRQTERLFVSAQA